MHPVFHIPTFERSNLRTFSTSQNVLTNPLAATKWMKRDRANHSIFDPISSPRNISGEELFPSRLNDQRVFLYADLRV